MLFMNNTLFTTPRLKQISICGVLFLPFYPCPWHAKYCIREQFWHSQHCVLWQVKCKFASFVYPSLLFLISFQCIILVTKWQWGMYCKLQTKPKASGSSPSCQHSLSFADHRFINKQMLALENKIVWQHNREQDWVVQKFGLWQPQRFDMIQAAESPFLLLTQKTQSRSVLTGCRVHSGP